MIHLLQEHGAGVHAECMPERWEMLGPLEAVNGSLMLGLSAAMLFTVLSRVADSHLNRNDEDTRSRQI